MIAYYVYGTLRFLEVVEARLKNNVDFDKISISYREASLTNFQRLVAATHEGANAAIPIKGQKINGEKIETVIAEAGTFNVPEGALLTIDGPALELIKVLPPLDRYETSYVKVEVPVQSEDIKRAYVYAAYPWRITQKNIENLPKNIQKLLNSLTEYYALSRMRTEEIQKFMCEAYEKEISKNKSGVVIYGAEGKAKIESQS